MSNSETKNTQCPTAPVLKETCVFCGTPTNFKNHLGALCAKCYGLTASNPYPFNPLPVTPYTPPTYPYYPQVTWISGGRLQ